MTDRKKLTLISVKLVRQSQALTVALDSLKQIAAMPRQRRARAVAVATVEFIETQLKKGQK